MNAHHPPRVHPVLLAPLLAHMAVHVTPALPVHQAHPVPLPLLMSLPNANLRIVRMNARSVVSLSGNVQIGISMFVLFILVSVLSPAHIAHRALVRKVTCKLFYSTILHLVSTFVLQLPSASPWPKSIAANMCKIHLGRMGQSATTSHSFLTHLGPFFLLVLLTANLYFSIFFRAIFTFYYCSLADMESDRNKHIRALHEKSRPFKCPECSGQFAFQDGLSRHISMVHREARPFKCPEPNCDKAFKQKAHAEKHHSSVHQKLKPCVCFCGAAFRENYNMKQHQRAVHNMNVPWIVSYGHIFGQHGNLCLLFLLYLLMLLSCSCLLCLTLTIVEKHWWVRRDRAVFRFLCSFR